MSIISSVYFCVDGELSPFDTPLFPQRFEMVNVYANKTSTPVPIDNKSDLISMFDAHKIFTVTDYVSDHFRKINSESLLIDEKISDYFAPCHQLFGKSSVIFDACNTIGERINEISIRNYFKLWGYGSPHSSVDFVRLFLALPSIVYLFSIKGFSEKSTFFVFNE